MKKSTIIIIAVVAILAIWGVSSYNGLVKWTNQSIQLGAM